jgi:uncharacterized protein (TIGR02145 family)
MKNKISFSLVLILLLALGGCTKKSTGPDGEETPELTLFSTHGAPGTVIGASVDGMTISPSSTFIIFDTVPAPIFAAENDTFSFLVPLIVSGEYNVFLQDSLSEASTTVSFKVDKRPNTGKPPGQITTDMLSSTAELVNIATSTGAKLTELGILTPSDSTVLSRDLNRITILLNSMQSDFTELPDSVKTMVDAFLYSAGLSDVLNTQNGGNSLGKCVRDLEMMLASSTPYDSFYVLVTLDNFSMVLSDLKAGLTVSSIAILIATGGTGAAASGAIAAISFGISVLDNIIDGALPTDLDRLQVSFIPKSGPELNVGEKATVKVVGRFGTQKSPEDATVDVILSGLFYGIEINLAEYLEDATEQIALKFAHAMAVSLDDVITNVRRVTLPHSVSVDINYYENDFDGLMTATGMTLLTPGVVVALDLISLIFDPDFGVAALSFSTSAISHDPGSNEITALATGTLSRNNVSPNAWACKPLCTGPLSFLCFGAEWPNVIEDNEHTVQAITIYVALDDTEPSAVMDLEVKSVTSNSATLEWTAPGDDGNTGTASEYDIRYSTSNITESNWSSATECNGEPTPKLAGSSESFIVTGLKSSTTYYFAIKTSDEVLNWSELSSVTSAVTLKQGIEFGEITDPRDTQVYKTVKIGSQWWIAENLNYPADSGCWCYNDSCGKYGSIYGRLYNWKAACKSCPHGWHLPSADEVITLIDYLGGELVAGGKLKSTGTIEEGNGLWHSPNTGATNESGFGALPASCWGMSFNKPLGYECQFWTLRAFNFGGHVFATFLKLSYDHSSAICDTNDCWGGVAGQAGISVRCIRNSLPDKIPPSLIYDLQILSKTTHSITLSWTAPGDDGYDGTASKYDIRYLTSNTMESDWNNATQCTGEPAPKSAGGSESFKVTGLSPNTGYYFGMKTTDEVPNWSELSNVTWGKTPIKDDTISPGAVTNLAASDPTSHSIKLIWTAPGDDGNTGTASEYDIRYSTSNITESNWSSAIRCMGEPTPKPAGSSESFVVSELNPNTTYYFAIKTADEVPNWSELSNTDYATTEGSPGTWERTYGGSSRDVTTCIANAPNGDYFVAGYTSSFGSGGTDYYLLRINELGNLVWQKTYGGSGDDFLMHCEQTFDGGCILAGYTNSYGAGSHDIYVIKVDGSGNVVWDQTYGGEDNDQAYCVTVVAEGGYIITGTTSSFGELSGDLYLIRIDGFGNLKWQKTYGGSYWDNGNFVLACSDGQYFVCGRTDIVADWDASDIYLLKLNAKGEKIWEKVYTGDCDNAAEAAFETSDGSFIIVGSGCGAKDKAFVMKVDASGDSLWEQCIGDGTGTYKALSVVGTGGDYVVAGWGIFAGYTFDVLAFKISGSGNIIWQQTYGGIDVDMASYIVNSPDGGYLIGGLTKSFGNGEEDVYLIKIDSDGGL